MERKRQKFTFMHTDHFGEQKDHAHLHLLQVTFAYVAFLSSQELLQESYKDEPSGMEAGAEEPRTIAAFSSTRTYLFPALPQGGYQELTQDIASKEHPSPCLLHSKMMGTVRRNCPLTSCIHCWWEWGFTPASP